MSVTPRAIGGRYYRVMVNGVEWSKHTTWYLAGDSAQDVAADAAARLVAGELTVFPLIEITEDAKVVYEYDPDSGDVPDTYDPTAPAPMSDGGEDLGDFLNRQLPAPEGTPTTTVASEAELVLKLDQQVQDSRDMGIGGTRLYPHGKLGGIAIKGITIQWWRRVRGFLKVGSGST